MRMRPFIPCLLAPALLAQAPADPAEARMAQVKADLNPASPCFLWLSPDIKRFQGAWELDPAFSRAASDREITYSTFGPGEAAAWAVRLGWGPGDHWLLLSPEGEPILSGTASPEAPEWLEAMRGAGWTPRADRLSQFLREHPDNGDAWAESLLDAAVSASHRLLVQRRLAGKPGLMPEDFAAPQTLLPAEQDEDLWGTTRTALNGFMGVDGWVHHRKLLAVLSGLELGGARASRILQEPFQRMERAVEAELQRDPSSLRVWYLWSPLQDLAPGGDVQALMSGLDAAPRQAWPPFGASGPIGDALAKAGRWPELEALATQAYAQGMDPSRLAYQGADARMQVVYAWGGWRAAALAKLGRREELPDLLKALRADSGVQWPDYASRVLSQGLAYQLDKDDPIFSTLKAANDEPPPPDPPSADFPSPLHLVLAGHPAWEKEWQRYAGLSCFDAWEPDEELGWKPLTPAEDQALRARMGWGPEAHWALMRGPEVLASGTGLPTPLALADRLRAEGTPYLAQLDAFIRTHPDRLDAREARLTELRGRMPNERLEAELLGDARSTLTAFGPGDGTPMNGTSDWTPRQGLWEPAARKVVPELEARIRRWPERANLWEAWFDWTSLMDRPPSPANFMDGLDIWKTRFDGGAGPLPESVMVAGTMALGSAARWKDLADWCQRFWEGGVRAQLEREVVAIHGPRPPRRREDHQELVEAMLLTPYVEALGKLNRRAQLQALLQDIQTMDPSLAQRLKASSTPPRPGK
ncbi:MAG: hypothetical protein JST05_07155 [Acidobacteria bacterium]|nr:hypothetical protein [Acidobacteriota bacterium]